MQSFHHNLTDFQNSFIIGFVRKYYYVTLQKFPSHLKCVTTLPCEIWMFKIPMNLHW